MKRIRRIFHLCITLAIFTLPSPLTAASEQVATFAGGCFWSMQHDFDKVPGVVKTVVGYTGGHVASPTYEQVSAGDTGHYEAIEVTYDPAKISYPKLLAFYWHDIDPGDSAGQFCDQGNEYHSVIFYHNAKQHKMAMDSLAALDATHRFSQIATLIKPAQAFYPAEDYHQKYAQKNPQAYQDYRLGCGRDKHTQDIWGTTP